MKFAPLVLISVSVVVAAACGGGDDVGDATAPAASATADVGGARTARPVASPSPLPGTFHEFAAEIDAALRAGDAAFFGERLQTEPVVCDETNTPPRLGDPACEFIGQQFDGVLVGSWRSEGAVVPAEAAIEHFERLFATSLPDESDQFGTGGPRVYAISAGEMSSGAVVTALVERPPEFAGEGPLRAVLSTHWVYVGGGQWRLGSMIVAYVLAEDFLIPNNEVRPYYPNWERFEND